MENKLYHACLGVSGCNHPVGDECDCKCHHSDNPQLDWRERFKDKFGYTIFPKERQKLLSFIAEVEKLAEERGYVNRGKVDAALETGHEHHIRSSLKAELCEKLEAKKGITDSWNQFNSGLSAAQSIIKSA